MCLHVQQAAEESRDAIEAALYGADMVFVTVGGHGSLPTLLFKAFKQGLCIYIISLPNWVVGLGLYLLSGRL